jgi:hypothetical protein
LWRLGHLEWGPDDWSVTPPTVVWNAAGFGWLCGARDRRLWQKLTAPRGLRGEQLAQAGGPDLWRLTGDADAAQGAAEAAKCQWVDERGGDLLAALPPVSRSLRRLAPEAMPGGREWERFTLGGGSGQWQLVTEAQTGAAGLYRARTGAPCWRWRTPDATLDLATPEQRLAARWAVVRPHLTLTFHQAAGRLAVPWAGVTLPLLVDRALRLPTGACPRRGAGVWVYDGVEAGRARHVARILELPLTVQP